MKKTFIIFLLLLLATPLASAQSVSIGDYSAVVDSEITVPIIISDAETIAGGVINISFNSSIVTIEDVVAGDFGAPMANVNNTDGWVKLVAASVESANKSEAVLANLVFNVSSIGISDLRIVYVSLNDESGEIIVPVILNGSITANSDYIPQTNRSGLVAEWHFDEGAGNVVGDSSGNGNDGIIYGATWIDGKFGKALQFDNTDDYVEVPNTDGVFDLVTSWTLEAWVKPFSPGMDARNDPIVWKIANNGHNQDTFLLAWSIGSKFATGLERASDDTDFGVLSSPHTEKQWYHVVGVYNGTNLKIYTNGILEGSRDIASFTTYTGPAPLRIGNILNSNHGNEGVFDGIIDEIRIYNCTLSAEEIRTEYRKLITLPSVNNLSAKSSASWINWTWTNPSDFDFNHTIVYIDGIWKANTSKNYYNLTGLLPGTTYTISTHTVDINGNINDTWINDTAKTTGELPGGLDVIKNKPSCYSIYPVGEQVLFDVGVMDSHGNPISSDISAYVELKGPNNTLKHITLSENCGNFVGEYTVKDTDSRGLWTGNITVYNSTSSGQTPLKVFFTGAYFIQPNSNSHSYLLGESANFTAKVVKPDDPSKLLSDVNLSLNLSIYPFNSSTPVLESVEMTYDNDSGLFSTDVSTNLIGSGLFTVLFIGNDTSGNVEVASLSIGVSEDYIIEVDTEKTYYDLDETVNISGIVKYVNDSSLSNVDVNLVIDLHGFKRSYGVTTNGFGEFNYSFHPFATEAGNYTVKATAANMGLLRNAESDFTIHGLYVDPQSAIVDMVENSSRTISYTLHNLGDTTLTSITTSVIDLNTSDNVVATIDPLSMPSQLNPCESASFNLQIDADTHVPDEAKFQIEVTSDQTLNEISELQVNLFSPTPILIVYPEKVLVGLNQNQTSIETVSIYNMGYGNLRNVTLHQPENSWMRITSNTSIGDLQPGENATFDIHVNSFNVDLGTYFDSVDITSDNYNKVQVNLTSFVTDLQNGSLLFHVTDALEKDLSNASVSLISKETYDEFDGITNSSGYVLLENLPVGKYIFEVSSDGTNTLPQMGTVEVEAMEIPELIEISLYMSFIDFDWEVTPTSIEDYYNIILKMRFETDVPIPLLLAFPPSLDYNMVQGEEKTGSFKVYNVGLVSIYNVSISPINYNGIILDPLVTNVDEIKGKSSIEVPYKISLSSNAANCQRLSGMINIQGRYVHFINDREVISYARTSIPVTVKTPVDGSCIPDFPDWPDIRFCVNIDGLHIGDHTEDLEVDPNIIWLRTGPGWKDQNESKSPVLEDVAIAKNNNTLGNIQLSNAMGITLSLGVNELVSYFTANSIKPQIPLGVDIVDVIAGQYGINIPCFDGIWKGTFDPKLISPQQSANLNMEKLDTGVGLTLPKILGGGIIFNFGDEECYNCVWVIPIAGYDLTLPTFGLPDIEIYIPHVYLGGGRSISGGSIGSGDFSWNSVPDVFIAPSHPHFRGTTYVPWNWPDWNWPDFSIDQVHRKPRPRVTETIHEVIELSISQNVTMERDAFWAGLGIFNKMPDKNIDNVMVTLHVKDDGGYANDKFFIKAPHLKGISNVDGSGIISPSGLATSQWLIIPKPGAGGINPEGAKYNISANITYSVDGINFETVTHEAEIVVKPQPEIVLDYFIPSDVIANKPFKLAVKVTNEGYGEARNFAIETAQPVIYYNPSALLVDFEIIRSQLQGEERSTSMKVDFGDIQPGESKIAWWDMVTSIDGTFTEFTGEFTHSSELGGMETSLIKDINTYIIQKQMGTGELGYDFLANSESDENYYVLFNSSTGSSTFVNNANYAVVNMPTPENPVLDVSIEDYTGEWVIVSLEDPYNNEVSIEKVIRTSDGTEIPLYNYWMRGGRILIVDHYDDGFDGKYSIIYSGMPEPGITVTFPNGGEEWYVSNTYTIQWVYAGDLGSNVKIELLNSEGNTIDITSSTSIGSDGTGSYNWKIPLALAPGTDYRVKVTSITNSYYDDLSDGHFTIDLPSAPKIISGPKINMTNNHSVIVQWETDISSNSQVRYGKSPSFYEYNSSYLDIYNTKHEVRLENIDYQQTYYYNLSSSNELGDKVESEEYNFKFIASSSVDGYNFSNWNLTDENLKEIKESASVYLDTQGLEYLIPIWNIVQSYRWYSSQSGHCYGMAATSILYFENELIKPNGYKTVVEIPKESAQENIEKYQINQISTTAFVYDMVSNMYSSIGKIFDGSIITGSPFNGTQEFEKLIKSIDSNKPLLITLNPGLKGAHAVTPIGYSSNSIYIYDNSLRFETHELKFSTDRIEYIENPYLSQNIDYKKLISETPSKDLSGFNERLRQVSKYLKNELGNLKKYIVTLKCPADLRIVDQYGRIITTINGDINEIPDAILDEGDESEIYVLPSELKYTVEMIGTGTGKADLSFASKYIILTFDDIPITSLTRGKMYIGRTNSYILSLDNNDDGIIDEYLTPMIDTYTENGYNITFLSPITTMTPFSLKDGSTLPIKFTVRNSSTDEFTYDTTVNITITNSTSNVITYFTNGTGNNSVRINSIDEQYAVDFNTNDYPELIIGKPYSIQVTFGDIDNLQGYAIAYFTLIDGTPSSITNIYSTVGTTWINWTWTNPSDPDFNHTELYLNGTSLTNIPAPQNYHNITGLLPDTSYELSTRTVDTSGNINETWVNATARTLPLADTTPPIITFTPPTDPGDTTLTTRNWTFINVSLSEPGISWLEWNGINESMSGSGTYWYINKTGLDNSVYTYRVWANDSAGNVNVSETRAIEIDYVTDTLSPVITITSPVNGTIYNTDSVDLNYSVNEPSVWQAYSLDGAANITLHGNTTLTDFADGLHTLRLYANDTSGNMNSSTVWFTIDTTIPVVNMVTLNTTTPDTGEDILVTVTATDNTVVISVVANGVALSYQSGDIWSGTITAIAGTHIVNVSATDAGSNVGWNNSTSYTTTIQDTITPVVNMVTLNTTTPDTGEDILVTVNATDNTAVISVVANDVALVHESGDVWTGSIIAIAGTQIVNISAADAAGNVGWNNSTSYIATTQDTIPPVVNMVTLDTTTPDTGEDILVTVTATDNTAVISVEANGVALSYQSGDIWSGTITAIAGTHTVNVSATDAGGNVGWNNSTSYTTTIQDTIPPVVEVVTLNTTTPDTGEDILVTVNATDNTAVISVEANGVALVYQSGDIWTGSIIAIAGTHIVNISAADAAGNIGWNNSTSYAATTQDTTPPAAITNLHPTSGTTYLNWTWTNPPDPDFNHTEIYLNGTFQTNTSAEHYNATDLTPETSYTISTRTVDTSGNINQTWMNDTATTLPALGTTIQLVISLNSGWNLISAPLNLNIWELGEEAAVGDPLNVTPENSLTSIYRYNTTSGSFEKCTHYADWGWAPATGSKSFTELEPGRGYWVMAENDCDLTFTGIAPSDLDVPLDADWNCIGWYLTSAAELGEEAAVGNPLSIVPENSLTSIYRYNTTSELFEKCTHYAGWGWAPATGSEGFTELEPGRGYWAWAEDNCVWNHET